MMLHGSGRPDGQSQKKDGIGKESQLKNKETITGRGNHGTHNRRDPC